MKIMFPIQFTIPAAIFGLLSISLATLLAEEGENDPLRGAIASIPVNRVNQNLRIPIYEVVEVPVRDVNGEIVYEEMPMRDNEGKLRKDKQGNVMTELGPKIDWAACYRRTMAHMQVEELTIIDEARENLDLVDVAILLYPQNQEDPSNNQPPTHVQLITAKYNTLSSVLSSSEESVIYQENGFVLVGESMDFSMKSKICRMDGHVRLTILDLNSMSVAPATKPVATASTPTVEPDQNDDPDRSKMTGSQNDTNPSAKNKEPVPIPKMKIQ